MARLVKKLAGNWPPWSEAYPISAMASFIASPFLVAGKSMQLFPIFLSMVDWGLLFPPGLQWLTICSLCFS